MIVGRSYGELGADMEDIGKRIDHLMELQKWWADGLAILSSKGHHSPLEKEIAKELKICLENLYLYITKDYRQTYYAKEINELKSPEEEP